jgi:hypothetical protein
VQPQRTTQEIRAEELVPLLATSSGVERITAPIPAVTLDELLCEARTPADSVDIGELVRRELEPAAPRSWAHVAVVAASCAATLALGLLILAG